MLRLVRLLTRTRGISAEAFAQFRRDQLGPFVAGQQTRLALSRYVQTHRDASSAVAEHAFLALRPGVSNGFDGIEEYWWANEAICLAALQAVDGAYADIEHLAEVWIDADASTSWLAVDYPQVATSSRPQIAAPSSGITRLVFAVAPAASLNVAMAQKYWLTQHGPLIRSFAAARGMLAYSQVHRLHSGGDATFPGAGSPLHQEMLGHAEAWFSETRPAPGADGLAARTAAVADEQNFIDWTRSSVFIGKELVFVDRTWA